MRGEDAGGPGPRGGADGRGESAPPGASGGAPWAVGVPARAGLAAGLGLDLEVSQAVPPNTRSGRGEWPMAAAAAVASGGGLGPPAYSRWVLRSGVRAYSPQGHPRGGVGAPWAAQGARPRGCQAGL